jgi:hypothetical protein
MLSDNDSGVCPFCRFQNEEGALLCERCAETPPPMVPSAPETGAAGVICPYCLFVNESGALFCEQCQSDLMPPPPISDPLRRPDKKQRWGLWCPYCRFRNEDTALFCLRCLSDLAGVAPARQ